MSKEPKQPTEVASKVVKFPARHPSRKGNPVHQPLTDFGDESLNENPLFQNNGIFKESTTKEARKFINDALDEGCTDLLFFAITKEGNTVVNYSQNTTQLLGLIERVKFNVLYNSEAAGGFNE